jgi:tetrahydromethanopterin S-methyltransferase subunit G
MAKKKMTIETLAAASQEQFLALEKKIDTVEGKVDVVLSTLENLSGQMADIKQSLPSALDFARLEGRIDVIEKKLGIESRG